MKSFSQFSEQAAAAAAPAPTPKVAFTKSQAKAKPNVTDPSTGVDIDDKGRWQGQVVNVGKELEPEKTEVTPGRKGPDPNLPAGSANPNKKKDYLDGLMNKAPGTHTAAERQALIDAGLDDFVSGGKTQATGVDAAGLGLAAAGGAALGLSGAASGLAGVASGAVSKGKDLAKGVSKAVTPKPKPNPYPTRYGGYNSAGQPNNPLKGEPGYKPPAPKTPKRGYDEYGNYTGMNYSKGRGMGDRW
tara:strand:+ start:468 stop:1199 length:732 start_codon:yes stop_codon:yes gene_type:complete